MTNRLTRSDILNLDPDRMPLLVFSDGSGLLPWLIRRLKGAPTHVMWMRRPGRFVSQERRLVEKPAGRWLEGRHRLWVWRGRRWDEATRAAVSVEIARLLESPDNDYDYLGILGQLLDCSWLNNPWDHYCSEMAAHLLRVAGEPLDLRHPDPRELMDWCRRSPRMELLGHYDPEQEEPHDEAGRRPETIRRRAA